MRLAQNAENEDTWLRTAEMQMHRHRGTAAPRATGKVLVKVQAKSKGKGKKRTPETCMCCGKEGHKEADCKFKTATCSNCGMVRHLRAVCRNTNRHEIEKDADEPSPEVTSLWKKFDVWMFMTLSAMVTAPRSTTYFQNIVMSKKKKTRIPRAS